MNPRMIVCYICGREFGSLSINIHTPKCLEKWQIENNKLPKNKRRPDPLKPQVQKDLPIGASRPSVVAELQRQNEAAYAAAKDAMLSTCDNCQRRFLPVQLVRHQKACRPGVTTFKRTKSAMALRRHPKRVIIIKMPPGHIPGPLGRGPIHSTFHRPPTKLRLPSVPEAVELPSRPSAPSTTRARAPVPVARAKAKTVLKRAKPPPPTPH